MIKSEKLRYGAIILIISLLINIFPVTITNAAVSDWALEEIEKAFKTSLVSNEIVRLDYKKDITRSEFCNIILNTYFKLINDNTPIKTNKNTFKDTSDEFVLMCYELNIVSGLGDSIFKPNEKITRQEMAIMLNNMLKAADRSELKIYSDSVEKYVDKELIANWALDSVGSVLSKGLMNGTSEDTFEPQSNASIEQAMLIAYRSLTKLAPNLDYINIPVVSSIKEDDIVPLDDLIITWSDLDSRKDYKVEIIDATNMSVIKESKTSEKSITIPQNLMEFGKSYTVIISTNTLASPSPLPKPSASVKPQAKQISGVSASPRPSPLSTLTPGSSPATYSVYAMPVTFNVGELGKPIVKSFDINKIQDNNFELKLEWEPVKDAYDYYIDVKMDNPYAMSDLITDLYSERTNFETSFTIKNLRPKRAYDIKLYTMINEDEKTVRSWDYRLYVPSVGDVHSIRENIQSEVDFETEEDAESKMKTIKINIWKLDKKGQKVASTTNLTVHYMLADVFSQIFEEIFNGEEQFPIRNVGAYNWRPPMSSGRLSEHNYGTAIDINSDENYCIYPSTGTTIGKHWKPYEDPHSIPPKGDVIAAFERHGFTWGGDSWNSPKDYMHFSYFGT